MIESTHSILSFVLGEVINPDDHDIRIKITAIDPQYNTLVAEVIKAKGHFAQSQNAKCGHAQSGFGVGMKLLCKPLSESSWTIQEKSGLFRRVPWFTLRIRENGLKQFEHYRY